MTPFSLRIFVADGDPDGLRIADFGTRRRHGFLWQRWCIQALKEGLSKSFIGTSNVLHAMENELGGKDFSPVTAAERKAIPINCHVCNIQDGAIAFVENDRVVKLEGNPEHVSTRGRLCAKGNSGMWYSYDPDALALYDVDAGGGCIEEEIDQMILNPAEVA